MSVLERIKGMAVPAVAGAGGSEPPSQSEGEIKLRRKAGVLAAFGLSDKTIADTLFLSLEQVSEVKASVEFRESCAKQTEERTQRLIDLEEGWDAVEQQGVAQVMQALQYSRDPDFALRAAAVANRAQRRAPASVGRVIDASNVGNVITLTVNKNYVTNITAGNAEASHAVIDAEATAKGEIPRKSSDVSSPKRLGELLQLESQKEKNAKIMKQAEILGISLDELDEIMPGQ
jgi:hypothetical protein